MNRRRENLFRSAPSPYAKAVCDDINELDDRVSRIERDMRMMCYVDSKIDTSRIRVDALGGYEIVSVSELVKRYNRLVRERWYRGEV